MFRITKDELNEWKTHGCDYAADRVSVGDEVDEMFGIGSISITQKDIEWLKNGGLLYTNDGEYATLIYFVGEDDGEQ
jgi:hypothetical protein